MDDEIEVFSDGDGVAVFGESGAVERFLASIDLASDAGKPTSLGSVFRAGSTAAQAGSGVAANSGRWLKLTKESAENLKQIGLMDTNTPGVKQAMLGKPGSIKKWLQVESGPASLVSNPALLSGAAGVMAQLAMQQALDEITDYLARIDEKLDDVLRAQTNQVLARMDGVALAVKEAMSVRDAVGRVSEVTWSKVQSSSTTILDTQAYALRQLGDLADKVEHKTKVGDLAKVVKDAEAEAQKWVAVLARCFQLHDAVAVLELDRVLDSSSDELDRHRLGLKAARADRLALIAETTQTLLDRMTIAVERANSKVLFNPIQSPAIVTSSKHVTEEVLALHGILGIESESHSADAKKWKSAAGERWDKVRETSVDGLDVAKGLGSSGLSQVKSVKGKLGGKIGDLRRRNASEETSDDSP